MVQSIHTAVKGRARFKVAGLYRSEYLKKHLEARLSEKSGIIHISVNTLTGNVLVCFNSGNSREKLALLIKDIVSEHRETNGKRDSETGSLPSKDIIPAKQKSNSTTKAASMRKLRKLVTHAEDQATKQWHIMDANDVVPFFNTSVRYGLSSESAKKLLKKYGPNLLPESVPRSGLSIFLNQFKSLPVALLGVAAGISLLTGGLADALVIAGVVVINGVIGYATETQAEKTIHSLKSLVRPSALLLRECALKEAGAEDIVPGDILILRPGSYIPADARLIEAHHLSVDESALTGESMPALKSTEALKCEVDKYPDNTTSGLQSFRSTNIPLADRTNMVYMGTLVTGGQGIAVVTATGRFTEIGRIQTLVGDAQPPVTPMEIQLDRMGTQLVLISGAVCGLVFIIGLLRGYGFLQMLKTSISLAVAAVPEGLPTIATTTLALGIREMRKRHVLIRHLNAVETLGSVQTICLDKTGTITMNRMSIVSVHTGMRRIKASDGKFIIHEGSRGQEVSGSTYESLNPFQCDELLRLIHVSTLCNESEVSMQEGEYIVNGTPTENALIHMAISAGVDVIQLRNKYSFIKINHRSENLNFMSSIHEYRNNNKHYLVALKGSPAEVLTMCSYQIKDGEKIPLNEDNRLAIETENERMAGNALRVLAAAYCHIKNSDDDFVGNKDLVWLGLIGMADPIRNGVKDLMAVFHQAGIDTVMITGDQGPTAYAIGKELNLSKGEQLEILDSTHLASIEPDVMKALSQRVHVFSRVSPAHKLQIVQALQQTGRVVAMTGDGINDGPALKAANIGIAMGHTGTDVAREVADVVIEDDNLETMIIAISQGRTIYNNIRKSVHFLLSTNLSEIMVMFTAIAGGLGQPLNAMQLLWINLISDIAPGLALALEPPEPDILSQPPRNPDEPIIKSSDFKRIAFESAALSGGTLAAYGYGIMRYGIGPRANTMAFMTLSVAQLLHAISCRSEQHSIFDKEKLPPNRYLTVALGGSFGLQFLSLTVPGLRSLLGLGPIGIIDGIVIGSGALLPLLINEGTKHKTPKNTNHVRQES
ncbi:MAG: HAD-IC family P-type ATPase [Nitrospirota bacterium]